MGEEHRHNIYTLSTLKFRYKYEKCYLNPGVGEPWAGHVSAISEFATILNARESTMLENFGLADPIGSGENSNLNHVTPECGQ